MSTLSRVIDVPLQERIAVDEVEALARVGANVGNNEVVLAGAAANVGVERARPELRVSGELELGL